MAKKSSSAAASATSAVVSSPVNQLGFAANTLDQKDLAILAVSLHEDRLQKEIEASTAQVDSLRSRASDLNKEIDKAKNAVLKSANDVLKAEADSMVDSTKIAALITALQSFKGMRTAEAKITRLYESAIGRNRISTTEMIARALTSNDPAHAVEASSKVKVIVRLEVGKEKGDELVKDYEQLFELKGFESITDLGSLGLIPAITAAIPVIRDLQAQVEALSNEINKLQQDIAKKKIELSSMDKLNRRAQASVVAQRLSQEAGGAELIEKLRESMGTTLSLPSL